MKRWINFNFKIGCIFEEISTPVLPFYNSTIRSLDVQDIVRDAIYVNGKNGEYFGINLSAGYKPVDFIKASASYNYNNARNFSYLTENKFLFNVVFNIAENGFVHVSYFNSGASEWESFKVKKDNDYFSDSGFEAKLESFYNFNLGIEQKLINFYGINSLSIGLNIENIFNERIKYLPIGNYIDRTILLFVSTTI